MPYPIYEEGLPIELSSTQVHRTAAGPSVKAKTKAYGKTFSHLVGRRPFLSTGLRLSYAGAAYYRAHPSKRSSNNEEGCYLVEAVVPLVKCDHLECDRSGCVCPCHGTVFPLVDDEDSVKRVGLGYHGLFPADGVELTLERIRESRGEIHGELFVRLVNPANFRAGHLFGGNFNASSLTARGSMAKHLAARDPKDWIAVLERFCLAVLRGERRGSEFQVIGRLPARRATNYVLAPILPLCKPTILFGPGGTGKSTMAGGIAVAVATGAPIMPGWSATPGAVLFLDWEEDDQTWNDRFQAIAVGGGIPAPAIHYRRMERPFAEEVESVAKFINSEGVLLVIVDALGLALGSGREGEAWADGTFRLFEGLRQLDVTSLLIDHVAGGDLGATAPTSKPFGSIYKVNLARSVFELRAERDGSGERTELLMVHSKSNGPRLPSQGWAIIREENAIRFERSEIDAPELVSALSIGVRMQRALRAGALPMKGLADLLGVNEASVRSVVFRDHRGARTFAKLPDGRVALASN